MTDDQRLSAIIDSWLVEGPKRMPDRVVDVVADRISHQSQRRAWRFPGWELHMPSYPRIAAAVAAIAILAIGGIYLFGQFIDLSHAHGDGGVAQHKGGAFFVRPHGYFPGYGILIQRPGDDAAFSF